MKKIIFLSIMLCAPYSQCAAQNSYEEFAKKARSEYAMFEKTAKEDYETFREKVNREYSDMMRQAWAEMSVLQGKDKPKEEKKIPKREYQGNVPVKDNRLLIKEAVKVAPPNPQPQPVAPVIDNLKETDNILRISFYGMDLKFKVPKNGASMVDNVSGGNLANLWKRVSDGRYTNLLKDCLDARAAYNMCDWEYLQMVSLVAEKYAGGKNNGATFTAAYLFCQSGYKVRLASSGQRVFMLYGCDSNIYGCNYFNIDGSTFYVYGDVKPASLANVCKAQFPNERPLSLLMNRMPTFESNSTAPRTIRSHKYGDVQATVRTNKNLIDFYNSYPIFCDKDNPYSKWNVYANSKLCSESAESLYGYLRNVIKGLSQYEAVSRILDLVQTGFEYEYDDKVWGYDRPFFPDETLFYPYCDCEDRAILFTRVVRDLLGLDCVLIYYPGHLASAVRFTQSEVSGDYVLLSGNRFVVCDPTYINAPVGKTMPGMDNNSAVIIKI